MVKKGIGEAGARDYVELIGDCNADASTNAWAYWVEDKLEILAFELV